MIERKLGPSVQPRFPHSTLGHESPLGPLGWPSMKTTGPRCQVRVSAHLLGPLMPPATSLPILLWLPHTGWLTVSCMVSSFSLLFTSPARNDFPLFSPYTNSCMINTHPTCFKKKCFVVIVCLFGSIGDRTQGGGGTLILSYIPNPFLFIYV